MSIWPFSKKTKEKPLEVMVAEMALSGGKSANRAVETLRQHIHNYQDGIAFIRSKKPAASTHTLVEPTFFTCLRFHNQGYAADGHPFNMAEMHKLDLMLNKELFEKKQGAALLLQSADEYFIAYEKNAPVFLSVFRSAIEEIIKRSDA